jgi:hypothetical protein
MDQALQNSSVVGDTRAQAANPGCEARGPAVGAFQPVTRGDVALLPTTQLTQSTLVSFLEASRAAVEAGSLEEALRIIVWRGAEALQVQECIAYEHDPHTESIIPRAIFERAPSGWEKLGIPVPLSTCPAEKHVLERGESLLERISDPDLDPESLRSMQKWGEKTCFTIPRRG